MAEIDLIQGERIIYKAHIHWIHFAWTIILFPLIPIFIIVFIIVYLEYLSSYLIITNKRILSQSGSFNKKSTEILISKTEGISIEQDIFGNMFNYGTIKISGTGISNTAFNNIAYPKVVRNHVREQIELYEDGRR